MNEEITGIQLRKARISAIVFGLLTIFSLLTLVYVFIKKSEVDSLQSKVIHLEKQLELLKKKAAMQRAIAEAEHQRAEENYKRVMEMLKEAETKKLK